MQRARRNQGNREVERPRLRVFRRELEGLQVVVDGALQILLLRQNLPQLQVRAVMPLNGVCALEALLSIFPAPQVSVAHALVVPQLPVFTPTHAQGLLEYVERRLVPTQQHERLANLLHILDIGRVDSHGRLEVGKRLADLPAVTQDQPLHVQRVLRLVIHLPHPLVVTTPRDQCQQDWRSVLSSVQPHSAPEEMA
jgi:hypothetical protein